MLETKDWMTIANAFFGFTAIVVAIVFDYWSAAFLIVLAVAADLLDGRIARATKKSNEFGVHLDSLADAVSFGVAPLIIFLSMRDFLFHWGNLILLLGCLVFLATALIRLARFNAMGKSDFFEGMPTPVAALLLVFVAPVLNSTQLQLESLSIFSGAVVLQTLLILALAFAMISRFKVPKI